MYNYYRGTVVPFAAFDPNKDAEALHKAKKLIGANEDAIIQILTARNNYQRQLIKQAYKTTFGTDLVDDLKSELTGHLETVMVALLANPLTYDVEELKNALKCVGTHEKVLIEILATRNTDQIRSIVAAYKQEYQQSLEETVMKDTSGHFERMLVILLQASRQQGVDEAHVTSDAQALIEAGKKKFGADEDKFITIFGNRSMQHLVRVFAEYQRLSGVDIEKSISKGTSGHLKDLLLAVVKCSRNVPAYFAEVLYLSMKGLGTDDHTLIRVMVSRSEVDMLDIRAQFKTKYGCSLYSTIKGDTSGHYSTALLRLCGGDDA